MGRITLPVNYLVFDSGYRGACNVEDADQASFYLWVTHNCPHVNMFHVANESGVNTTAGHILKRRKKGVVAGVSDNIILSHGHAHYFGVIELKRRDKTKSKWQDGQREFLNKVVDDGGYAAVAYGLDEAKKAFLFYLHGCVDVDSINASVNTKGK